MVQFQRDNLGFKIIQTVLIQINIKKILVLKNNLFKYLKYILLHDLKIYL